MTGSDEEKPCTITIPDAVPDWRHNRIIPAGNHEKDITGV